MKAVGELHINYLRSQLQTLEKVYGPPYGMTNALAELNKMGEQFATFADRRMLADNRALELEDELTEAVESLEAAAEAANKQINRLTSNVDTAKRQRDEAWRASRKLEKLILEYAADIEEAKGPIRTVTKEFLEAARKLIDR